MWERRRLNKRHGWSRLVDLNCSFDFAFSNFGVSLNDVSCEGCQDRSAFLEPGRWPV